jgi:hypothetical protein
VPVNVKTVTEPETTLTDPPSGKTVQYDIVSANDADQAAPGDTVQILRVSV